MPLPRPTTAQGRAGLDALLAEPSGALVALDFDGTLAPIVARPEDARLVDGALAVLGHLADLVDAVVIVTGRPAAQAVELGGFAGAQGLSGLVVLGQYGLERFDAATGQVTAPAPHPGIEELRRLLPGELPAGVRLEDKRHALALHGRGAPAQVLAGLRPRLQALATQRGLELLPGREVLELRPPGVDKGGALREYAESRQARSLLYAGDDLGDLPAFDAVDALRRAGIPGVTVCSAADDPVEAVAARADLVVAGPAALVSWLDQLVTAARG